MGQVLTRHKPDLKDCSAPNSSEKDAKVDEVLMVLLIILDAVIEFEE